MCVEGPPLDLAAGHLDTLLREFSHESNPRYVAEMLTAPGEVQARLVAVDLEARQQLGTVAAEVCLCAKYPMGTYRSLCKLCRCAMDYLQGSCSIRIRAVFQRRKSGHSYGCGLT